MVSTGKNVMGQWSVHVVGHESGFLQAVARGQSFLQVVVHRAVVSTGERLGIRGFHRRQVMGQKFLQLIGHGVRGFYKW